jgi:hypothetical protein
LGDTVHFAGNTEYIADRTIKLTKSGITLTGDSGAFIRSSSSTLDVFLFDASGTGIVVNGLDFSGLGYTDNLDQLQPYQLLHFDTVNDIVIENCIFEHHHQYLVQLSDSNNFIVRNSTFRYGQNGFATYGTCNGGLIEYNEIHDCSQGPIKLRGCTGTVVRYNIIHLEYTYWRSFDHASYPGMDGRGITGHSGTACQGIYFGVTDPQPCFNCDLYRNTVVDASVHGTIPVIDVVDGTRRSSPSGSQGCRFPLDASTSKSTNNYFHDNTVNGTYYGVWVENYTTRDPQPITVYNNNTFGNIVQNNCYIT